MCVAKLAVEETSSWQIRAMRFRWWGAEKAASAQPVPGWWGDLGGPGSVFWLWQKPYWPHQSSSNLYGGGWEAGSWWKRGEIGPGPRLVYVWDCLPGIVCDMYEACDFVFPTCLKKYQTGRRLKWPKTFRALKKRGTVKILTFVWTKLMIFWAATLWFGQGRYRKWVDIEAENEPKCKTSSLTYSHISTLCAALVSQATLVYCWRRLKGDSFIVYKYLKRKEISGC